MRNSRYGSQWRSSERMAERRRGHFVDSPKNAEMPVEGYGIVPKKSDSILRAICSSRLWRSFPWTNANFQVIDGNAQHERHLLLAHIIHCAVLHVHMQCAVAPKYTTGVREDASVPWRETFNRISVVYRYSRSLVGKSRRLERVELGKKKDHAIEISR